MINLQLLQCWGGICLSHVSLSLSITLVKAWRHDDKTIERTNRTKQNKTLLDRFLPVESAPAGDEGGDGESIT